MRLFPRLALEQNSLAIKAANMTARSISRLEKNKFELSQPENSSKVIYDDNPMLSLKRTVISQ
jgi:hypothetical protein